MPPPDPAPVPGVANRSPSPSEVHTPPLLSVHTTPWAFRTRCAHGADSRGFLARHKVIPGCCCMVSPQSKYSDGDHWLPYLPIYTCTCAGLLRGLDPLF